ncbi:hypothetical protein P8X24_06010 [Pyrococcus kukulkanii]|uniref:hypothetical protein n=1 Tax=Pyrococcus kukulkanii TaxID=1609559 RepID=UPI003567B847
MASKHIFGVFLFLLILFSAKTVLASPYWLKEGVYMTYIARASEPITPEDLLNASKTSKNGVLSIVYNYSNIPFVINIYGNGSVNFTIVSIDRGFARVRLTISGNYAIVRYYYLKNQKPGFDPFWDEDAVIDVREGPALLSSNYYMTEIVLKSIILEGEYLIELNTGDVYDLKGNYYGKTILWNDPTNPLEKNETLCFDSKGRPVRIADVMTSNTSILTYYKTFMPPAVLVKTTFGVEKVPPDLEAVGRNLMIYDGSSGILLSMLAFHIPDAKAAGFPMLFGFDEYMHKLSWESKKEGTMVSGGLVLYDTNANFIQPKKNTYSPSTSPLAYAYLVGIIAVVLLALRFFVRRGYHE